MRLYTLRFSVICASLLYMSYLAELGIEACLGTDKVPGRHQYFSFCTSGLRQEMQPMR